MTDRRRSTRGHTRSESTSLFRTRDKVKVKFTIEVQMISNLPSKLVGKELFVKYRRGTKKSNQGRSPPLTAHSSIHSVNYSFSLNSKMFYDPKTKAFDTKALYIELEEMTGKKKHKNVGKAIVELADLGFHGHSGTTQTQVTSSPITITLSTAAEWLTVNGKALVKAEGANGNSEKPSSSMDIGGEHYYLKTSDEISAKDGNDSDDDDTTFDTDNTSVDSMSSKSGTPPALPPKPQNNSNSVPPLPPKNSTPPVLPTKDSTPPTLPPKQNNATPPLPPKGNNNSSKESTPPILPKKSGSTGDLKRASAVAASPESAEPPIPPRPQRSPAVGRGRGEPLKAAGTTTPTASGSGSKLRGSPSLAQDDDDEITTEGEGVEGEFDDTDYEDLSDEEDLAAEERLKTERQNYRPIRPLDFYDVALVIRLQAFFRGCIARKQFEMMMAGKHKRRGLIASEMLDTERSYVKQLTLLAKVYYDQLMGIAKLNSKPILTVDQINTIFINIQDIWSCNSRFLEELTPRIQKWSPKQKVGDLYIKWAPFFKVYGLYCQKYDAAQRCLQQCKAKDKTGFNQFLEESQRHPDHNNLTLEALLITPIQRLPRYILLIRDLLQHTWKEHPDYQNLEKSMKVMQETAAQVNSSVRQAENLAKMLNLQSSINNCPELVAPGRNYIREGPVQFCNLDSRLKKQFKDMMFYLFSDLIIAAKVSGSSSPTFREFIPFTDAVRLKPISDTKDVVTNAFYLITPKRTFTIRTLDVADKNVWMEAIQKQIDECSKDKTRCGPSDPKLFRQARLSASIVETLVQKAKGKSFTVYIIEVTNVKDGSQYRITHRFNEFYSLRQTLEAKYPNVQLASLPSKHILGNFSRTTVQSRKIMLESFLEELLTVDEIQDSKEVIEFFMPTDSDLRGAKLSSAMQMMLVERKQQLVEEKAKPKKEIQKKESELKSREKELERREKEFAKKEYEMKKKEEHLRQEIERLKREGRVAASSETNRSDDIFISELKNRLGETPRRGKSTPITLTSPSRTRERSSSSPQPEHREDQDPIHMMISFQLTQLQVELDLKRTLEECIFAISPGEEGCAAYASDYIFNFLWSRNYLARDPMSNTAVVQNIIYAIQSCMKRDDESVKNLTLWLSIASILLYTLKHTDDPTIQREAVEASRSPLRDPEDKDEVKVLVFPTDHQIEVSIELPPISYLVQSLELLKFEAYSLLQRCLAKRVEPYIEPLFIFGGPVTHLVENLGDINRYMEVHQLHPMMIDQIWHQLFYYFSIELMNSVLKTRDYCTASSGFQIVTKLTQLEAALTETPLHSIFQDVRDKEFQYPLQCAKCLIMCLSLTGKKDELTTLFPVLSIRQIQTLVNQFHKDKNSSRTISDAVRTSIKSIRIEEGEALLLNPYFLRSYDDME